MTSLEAETAQTPAPGGLRGRIAALMQRRATWILIDQGIVSIGNFATANLLGRSLPEMEFGLFGLLFETMNYLNGLQWALVIYPLTLKGATGDHEGHGRLATASMILTVGLLPLLGGAIAGSVGIVEHPAIALAAVAAMLLWQLQETLRRALISDLRIRDSVWGDSISYLGQALLILIAWRLQVLNLKVAFLIMAVTSAVAIIVQSMQIGLHSVRFWQIRAIARDYWRLGRWMLLTSAGSLVSSLGYWWTLKFSTWGLEACALYTAIIQFFKLANPVMSSMSGLILPAVARAMTQEGRNAATRIALRYTALGAALIMPYFAILLIFPTTALRLFYTSDKPYIQHPGLLRMFVLNYTIVFFLTMIGSWLMGLGRSRYNFYAQLVNMGLTVLVGLPLTAAWGVQGLIIGGAISAGLCLLASLFLIRKAMHEQPPAAVAV